VILTIPWDKFFMYEKLCVSMTCLLYMCCIDVSCGVEVMSFTTDSRLASSGITMDHTGGDWSVRARINSMVFDTPTKIHVYGCLLLTKTATHWVIEWSSSRCLLEFQPPNETRPIVLEAVEIPFMHDMTFWSIVLSDFFVLYDLRKIACVGFDIFLQ
jgi:hypothetical protein